MLLFQQALGILSSYTVALEGMQSIRLASSNLVLSPSDQCLEVQIRAWLVVRIEARSHTRLAHHVSVLDARFHLRVSSLTIVRHIEVILGQNETMILAYLDSVREVQRVFNCLISDRWLHKTMLHSYLVRVIAICLKLTNSFAGLSEIFNQRGGIEV